MDGDLPISEELASRLAGILEELKQGDLPPDVLRRRVLPLLHHPAHAIPLLLRQFESDDEEGLALATSALKALDDPSLIPRLLKLLRAPQVGDLAKGLILNLLEHYGFDTRDPSLVGASINLEEALRGLRSTEATG
ncbi:MAG: hypothetical protein HYY12_05300 [Candidatus Methylomirabilis oxyfera]|nr:hypothetical protein [Candidatus Methylomirabilis oxyfera]